MTPENLLAEWSRLFVESLADAGVRDAVVSPGSRSTPLAWAVLSCPRLRATSIIDERCAAFYAVGSAKITGRPVALVCTSGSAAANYLPAVVEAAASHTPLLVVTADRPFELHDCGASQTIDQTRLYGAHARAFVDLGMPEPLPSALAALRRRAVQCVTAALSPVPGPVHVNFRARKPLEPVRPGTPEGRDLTHQVDALLDTPYVAPIAAPSDPPGDAITRIAGDCASVDRGLIVCGPSSVRAARYSAAVWRLARVLGFPVYAEATSQHRFGSATDLPRDLLADGLDVLLATPSFRRGPGPDVVLQIEGAPVSARFEQWLATSPGTRRHVLAAQGWPDPTSNARSIVLGDVARALDLLATALEARSPEGTPRRPWNATVGIANLAAWTAIDGLLSEDSTLSEGAATRATVSAMPPGSLLFLGNSLPVRHADTFCRAGLVSDVAVASQRGGSGIDGVVSAAAGAAQASGKPTLLLVGDVSALHDLGGFGVAAALTVPFAIVILNNDGGRIFERLPLHEAGLGEDASRFWTTPHGRTFDSAARLFGTDYSRPQTVAALSDAVAGALARPGCTVIEATVPPHGARDQWIALASSAEVRVQAALGTAEPA